MNKLRKSVAIFFCSLLLITGSVTLAPQRTHAELPVIDFANIVQNTITAAKSVITGAAASKTLLNPIFYRIAQAAIQTMVHSTVNWINSGFHGSPAYSTDLNTTLQQAADVEAQRFVRDVLSNSKITSPFSDRVTKDVLAAYYLSTSKDGFALKNPYTLNKVSPDDAAFIRGDFTKGGFQAWFAATLNQQNNPIAARNLLQSELDNRVASVQGKLHEELGWGNGFFSFRKCDATGPVVKDNTQQSSLPVVTVGPGGKVTNTGATTAGPTTVTNLSVKQDCLTSHIETPGSVIANGINHSLGLGADSLVQAKEFDEIVNALLGQLMNTVLGSGGLGGLGHGSTASGGARGYFDQSTSATDAAASAGVGVVASFTQLLDEHTSQLQTYLTNWQTINAAANQAKTALTGSTCMPNADSIIATQVQPVITQATTAIGTVPTALAAVDKIRAQALNAVSASSGQQTQTLQDASTDYQCLTGGGTPNTDHTCTPNTGTMPGLTDFTYATQQSQDSGTNQPASLLTQMAQLTAQAKCGH